MTDLMGYRISSDDIMGIIFILWGGLGLLLGALGTRRGWGPRESAKMGAFYLFLLVLSATVVYRLPWFLVLGIVVFVAMPFSYLVFRFVLWRTEQIAKRKGKEYWKDEKYRKHPFRNT